MNEKSEEIDNNRYKFPKADLEKQEEFKKEFKKYPMLLERTA